MKDEIKIRILAIVIVTFLYPVIQALSSQKLEHSEKIQHIHRDGVVDSADDLSCKNELNEEMCKKIVSNGRCKSSLDLLTKACRKSCGICTDDEYNKNKKELRGGGPTCTDLLPWCDKLGAPASCCIAKDLMNKTCAKTCKFCMEISLIPGNPIQGFPGVPVPGVNTAPTVVTQQDPCDPTKPPTGGINPGSG